MHLSKWLKPALLLMTLSILAACGGGGSEGSNSGGGTTPPLSASFTVTTTTATGGSLSPSSASVTNGQTFSFTVIPDIGYSITNVTGCGGSLNGNTYTTETITSACSVNATFNLTEYQVLATTEDGGTISPEIQSINHGDNTTLVIAPDDGYSIIAVEGCEGNLNGNTYITGAITSDCSINASFDLNEYQVTGTAGDEGTISPDNQSINHGDNATLVITPDDGYSILSVEGCEGSLNGNTYITGTITSACSVNASFSLNVNQVTASAGDGGSISPNSQMVVHGENATFVVTPDNGYGILSVEGCNGSLILDSYTTDSIYDVCSVNALFNQTPSVSAGDDVNIIESDTLQQIAIATDNDGSITSYEWQQLTGPAFELHQDNTDTLVATAPLVEQDVIAIFQVTVTDEQGAQSTDEVSITIKLREPSLVNIEPTFDISSDITSVNADELSLVSLAADGEQVNDSVAPTLLMAKDNDGTVLLSLANQNGGFLGEAEGDVSLSIDSTAVTLIAVSAGYPVSAIGTTLIEQIKLHEQYQDLILQLNALLDADKNFLDRLFDYPDVVNQIKLIANTPEIASKPTQSNVSNYTKPKDKSFSRKLDNFQQSTTANSTSTTKDNFYCTPYISWPCSPWHKNETWQWFGDAKGIKTFYPDSYSEIAIAMIRSGFSPTGAVSYLTVGSYAELVVEATQPPFLARSLEDTEIHAIANPNFVNYAMEMYEDDEYQSWYYTPRNSTMVQKMLNSGAAQRLIKTGDNELLNPTIDKVRFQRYRLTYNTNSGALPDRALALSFMNTLGVVASGINLFADASEFTGWVHELPIDKLLPIIADCALDIVATVDIYEDTNANGAIEQAISFMQHNVSDLFETIPQSVSCMQIGKNLGGKTLKKVLARQSVKAGVEFVANLTPVGWAKLAFDGVNDTIPVFTSYFSGNAASSEYYLTWDNDADGIPYISAVSDRRLPSAKFTYTQKADFAIELDASTSVKDPSTSLSYEWSLNNNVIGNGQILTHNFAVAGNYTVTLNITDGFGNTANHDAQVKVNNGLSPVITSLSCSSLGGGNVEMIVDFGGDNNVESIHWYNDVRSPSPVLTTLGEENSTTVSFITNRKYVYGKVVVEDTAGNIDSKTCQVKDPNELIAGRYIIKGSTIIDTNTNLEWQRCNIGETWNGSSCIGSAQRLSWQESFDTANSDNTNGKKDWRLPNTQELLSIVYCSSGMPTFWKNTDTYCEGSYNRPTFYHGVFTKSSNNIWSSQKQNNDSYSGYADILSPYSGSIGRSLTAGNAVGSYLRLVRTYQPNNENTLTILKWSNPYESPSSFNTVNDESNILHCGSDCTYDVSSFFSNETITLAAISGDTSRWEFYGWEGDCSGVTETCTLSMDKPRTVVANFILPWNNYTLSTYIEGSGKGLITSSPSGINCSTSCAASFEKGSQVTLTAIPDSGYFFGGWSGSCSGNNTTCTVTMNQTKSVAAQFIDGEVRDKTLNTCDVWSAAQSGGSGTTVDNWNISTIPANATFDIKFDAESIPDEFTVEYAGSIKIETGWRGSSSYNGDPLYPGGISGPGAGQADNIFTRSSLDSFRVTVFGPENGTSWDYQVRCREN